MVALVILVFVGPKQLPRMLRKLGMIVGELRSASRELRTQIEVEMEGVDTPSKIVADLKRDVSNKIKETVPDPYEEIRAEAAKQKLEIEDIEAKDD